MEITHLCYVVLVNNVDFLLKILISGCTQILNRNKT